MNGIVFIPKGEITPESKLKLFNMMEKNKERLNKMIEDARNGKFGNFNDIIEKLKHEN